MTDNFIGLHGDRRTVLIACAVSLVLGLVFVFVRSPLPWGWEGIDHYHERALSIALGRGFPTMDVPAAYAVFLAAFYWTFGDRPVVPLCAQVVLNALVPWMMFRLVGMLVDRRTAALTALLVGLFSFNTAYASTQASDSVCNVLFVAGVLALGVACRHERLGRFALAGLLLGLASQFRPNLILFPFVAATLVLIRPAIDGRRLRQAVVLLGVAGAVCLPWTIRNYRLTGEIVPASTHGSIQLWYGSLQTGPFLDSRTYNPRSFYDEWPFQYSSVPNRSIVVNASSACTAPPPPRVDLVFWTDRQRTPIRLSPQHEPSGDWSFVLPGQPAPTAVYYYFVRSPQALPLGEQAATLDRPAVYFITQDLLDDPDRHGDRLDVFDVARLLKHLAWGEGVPFADQLDADGDGRLTERDLRAAVALLLVGTQPAGVAPLDIVFSLTHNTREAELRFVDGSTLTVPRTFDGRYTDLDFTWKLGQALRVRARPMADLKAQADLAHPTPIDPCPVVAAEINKVFYRDDPHRMHRYYALALDNIKREPVAFALASVYRAYRVFVVSGGIDVYTTAQFSGSAVLYALAHAASLTYFLLFLVGVALAVWRRSLPLPLLAPPAYVAVTIAPVLTNMRYSLTTQPFVLAFAAMAVLAALDLIQRFRTPRDIPGPGRPSDGGHR